jgi:hypothetical protein
VQIGTAEVEGGFEEIGKAGHWELSYWVIEFEV